MYKFPTTFPHTTEIVLSLGQFTTKPNGVSGLLPLAVVVSAIFVVVSETFVVPGTFVVISPELSEIVKSVTFKVVPAATFPSANISSAFPFSDVIVPANMFLPFVKVFLCNSIPSVSFLSRTSAPALSDSIEME